VGYFKDESIRRIEFILLALTFSSIIGVLNYVVEQPIGLFYHRPVPSILLGTLLGIPAAGGFLSQVRPENTRDQDSKDGR
jgi:hypothetical protein